MYLLRHGEVSSFCVLNSFLLPQYKHNSHGFAPKNRRKPLRQ
nr:MAG TPA: hypothetical protein [Caudoviricetes sp.]